MRLALIFLFSCLQLLAKAQVRDYFRHEKTVPGNYTDFEADVLGNLYLLSANQQLKKINSKGDSMGVFNDVRRYGKVHAVDVTNPLKCLVYFKNFSTIVVLDRFLQPVNTIDLRRQSIFQVKAVAQSYDNKIWLYDEQNQQLKKIDDNGNILLSTPDLRMVFDEVPSPEKIIDQEGYVYLYDQDKGVYIFDIYGAFKNKISYTGLKSFTVSGKTIAGIQNNELITYSIGTLNEKKYLLPVKEATLKCVLSAGRLFVLEKDKIEVYLIQ
jgi:hypothetical protein